jgi:hypothetical protein
MLVPHFFQGGIVTNKFISIMEAIGRDAKLIFTEVEKYLPSAATLAKLLFPAQSAAVAGVVNAVGLIQQAVALIEQKYAALGTATGTGAQKLAEALSVVTPTVTQLLAAEGLPVNATYIQNIVNAVVAILNVQTAAAGQ